MRTGARLINRHNTKQDSEGRVYHFRNAMLVRHGRLSSAYPGLRLWLSSTHCLARSLADRRYQYHLQVFLPRTAVSPIFGMTRDPTLSRTPYSQACFAFFGDFQRVYCGPLHGRFFSDNNNGVNTDVDVRFGVAVSLRLSEIPEILLSGLLFCHGMTTLEASFWTKSCIVVLLLLLLLRDLARMV